MNDIKIFKFVLLESPTGRTRASVISSDSFERAISKIYVRKHSLRSQTGNNWRIFSVEEINEAF